MEWNMSKTQTKKIDNSHLMDEVDLRINHLPRKKKITVLDTFHGAGTIWKSVQRKTKKEIQVIGIDKEPGKGSGLQLKGDNTKFMPTMDLSLYDVIDLDTYGIPCQILREIIKNGTAKKGTVIFATFTRTYKGKMPNRMLEDLGYSKAMIKKAPILLSLHPFKKFTQFLALHGIDRIYYIERDKQCKYYLCFRMPERKQQ